MQPERSGDKQHEGVEGPALLDVKALLHSWPPIGKSAILDGRQGNLTSPLQDPEPDGTREAALQEEVV